MATIRNILVALEQDDSADFVLDKGIRLAQSTGAALHVVRVMYDEMVDFEVHGGEERQALKTFLMQAGETWVSDLLAKFRERTGELETFTIWHREEHVGIIHAAEDCNADLVIKAAHRPDGIVIRTPQDWALMRHSDIPIMIVKGENWPAAPLVMAAIDAINDSQQTLNRHILEQSAGLAEAMGGRLEVIVAYPFMGVWTGLDALPADYDRMRHEIEDAIRQAVADAADAVGVNYAQLHLEEGATAPAIRARVAEEGADMLVLGTVAREGVKGVILGNTSESILYRTNADVTVLKRAADQG